MRYLLTEYDKDRFHTIDDLVRLCYFNPLNNLWGYPWKDLAQIGTDMRGLAQPDVQYIEANSSPVSQLNGVCFHKGDEFQVWLNPDMPPGSLLFELTLIHELCHGYVGPSMHGKIWRKYYSICLMMYGWLLNDDFLASVPEWQIKHTIRRYRNEEEDAGKQFSEHMEASDLEMNHVIQYTEQNKPRIARDFRKLQEMRKGCHASTSATTPTPAYLASLPKKAGTGFPSK
jgi:hypothetical protein